MEEENNQISVNFVKENENIYLSSIDENGNTTDYAHEAPLLKISQEGKYSKVEGVDLNNILTKTMEEARVNNDNNEIDFLNINNEEENKLQDKLEAEKRQQEELDRAFEQLQAEEDEKKRKQEELDQAFKQAEEEDEKKRKQNNEPEKKEIKKSMSLIDKLKNNKLFKQRQEGIQGGKKNRTKKSTKAGKKKTKRVRFVMTKKGRKNKKNRTRR